MSPPTVPGSRECGELGPNQSALHLKVMQGTSLDISLGRASNMVVPNSKGAGE